VLIFFDQNLVFFAVPKTGTTAYESALRRKADIIFRGRPTLKHINARKFDRSLAPYLAKAHKLHPERMAVLRDPLDQLRSWYRYRHQLPPENENSTAGMRFDDFVTAHLRDRPPPFAKVGTQFGFVTGHNGAVRIDHLFAVERPVALLEFLADRFGEEITVPVRNVSPQVDTTLDPDIRRRYETARADDYALYARVLEAGHLHTPLAAATGRIRA